MTDKLDLDAIEEVALAGDRLPVPDALALVARVRELEGALAKIDNLLPELVRATSQELPECVKDLPETEL